MIRATAPGRVNLIGDHTDYTGGLVLPLAIDRNTVVEGTESPSSIGLRSEEMRSAISLDVPVDHVASIEPSWGRYVAAVAHLVQPARGIEGTVHTDIPIGGGLSSSAALEVAVALALGADADAIPLALLCQKAEHLATGVPTGVMDQLCILSAREGHATLIDCASLEVDHIPVSEDVSIVVRFIAPRTLAGSAYATRVDECRRAEAAIGPLRTATMSDVNVIGDPRIRARARHVVSENDRVRAFAEAMTRGDWPIAGATMVASHHSLSTDYEVSTPEMDAAVRETLELPGVFGSRMTGGGFGGCIVTLCRQDCDIPGWRVKASGRASVVNDQT